MTERGAQIGFSQRVSVEWLELTANLVLAGRSPREIREQLRERLHEDLSFGGEPERGTREKVISILLRVWRVNNGDLGNFRNDGLGFLMGLPKAERVPIHWGMCLAAYPFVGAVAGHVGRLLYLQGSVAATMVQRRLRERYGERETVARATRRVLRSFIDWRVLAESEQPGVYRAGQKQCITNSALGSWLVEACLRGLPDGRASLRSVIESPSLFPFELPRISGESVRQSGRVEVTELGIDDQILSVHSLMG